MSDPFRDSWVKHNRALEHIQALSEECAHAGSPQAEPYAIVVEFESDVGCHVACFYEINPPHPRLGAIVGDVLHNLRSSLDVIAWKLALRHDKREAKRNRAAIGFPLTTSPKQFDEHDAIPFFSERTRTVIKRLQPYDRGDGNPFEALAWLSRLSNADKHRVATGCFSAVDLDRVTYAVDKGSIQSVKDLTEPGLPIETGAPIAQITVDGPSTAQVSVENYTALQILFTSDQGQIGLLGLAAIHKTVESALTELGAAFE